MLLSGIIVILLATPIALTPICLCSAQNAAIFGYNQTTYSGCSIGGEYSYYGTSFGLNGDATITSICCNLIVRYNPQKPDEVTHYRYAIYRDNGNVAELVAQTEIGSEIPQADNPLANDKWLTLNLPSPVTLHAGSYWLITVDDSQRVEIHTEQTNQKYGSVSGDLGSMDFSSSLETGDYKVNMVYAIYALGEGTVSVVNPPGPDSSNPGAAFLALSCQNNEEASGKVRVIGNLEVYGGGISQAIVDFAYRDSSNYTWQPFTQTTTKADGSFSADWTPPSPGSYVINATYWGNQMYHPTFTELNVLVTAPALNQTQNVFSVESNSDVTDLAFNHERQELSFSVSGKNGTEGYVDVCISKNLVADPLAIHAFIDNEEATHTTSELGGCWILHFTYHHSSHNIKFDLQGNSEALPEIPQETWLISAVILGAVVAVALILVVLQRKHRL